MSNFVAVYDSCVLYPAPLRDLLMYLALTDLFRAKWTSTIHDEWMRNVLANRSDLTVKQLERTRDLMDAHVRDCLITGHEKFIPTLSLPDPDDRHVLAAAIHATASIIVTYNLKDFPVEAVAEFDIQAQHPDDFVSHFIDLAPEIVCNAVQKHRSNLKNPPLTTEMYLSSLERQLLPQTVNKLKKLASLI